MSDEEHFDDDDDWGAEDAGKEDDWGDKEEEGWPTDDETGDPVADSQPDDLKTQIENAYYMAEANRKRSPQISLEQFQKCYDLEVGQEHSEEFFMRFKALSAIVSLQFQLGERKKMLENYKQLLQYAGTAHVSRNDSNDAVHSILNLTMDAKEDNQVDDAGFSEQLFALTLSHLKTHGGQSTQSLYFGISMKLCRRYLASGQFSKAESLLLEMHDSCRLPDGSDDLSKGSQLLEIYALQVQLLSAQGDSFRLKELFEKTRNLNTEVNDPRSMSIIQECWGKLMEMKEIGIKLSKNSGKRFYNISKLVQIVPSSV